MCYLSQWMDLEKCICNFKQTPSSVLKKNINNFCKKSVYHCFFCSLYIQFRVYFFLLPSKLFKTFFFTMIKRKNKYILYFLFWWFHITILRWRLKFLMSFNVYQYWFINHTSGWLELKQTYNELWTKTMIYTCMLHIKHSKLELCYKHESFFLDWWFEKVV